MRKRTIIITLVLIGLMLVGISGYLYFNRTTEGIYLAIACEFPSNDCENVRLKIQDENGLKIKSFYISNTEIILKNCEVSNKKCEDGRGNSYEFTLIKKESKTPIGYE